MRIGVVSFGIEANTDALKKAFGDIAKLRQKVNALANAQTKGAQQTRAALLQQEIATRRAGRTFVELRKKMVQSGAPEKQVRKLEQAFEQLTREMTSGKLAATQYKRSLQTFADQMAKVNGEFTKFKAGGDDNKMATLLRNLESSAVLAIGPLSGVGARIRSLGAIAGRSSPFVIALFVGVTALGVALGKLSSGAVNASRVMEQTFARFKAASGDIKIARLEMGFVTQTALSMGLRLDVSAKAFSRLAASAAGTALEGKGARDVFLAVSQAAAALRLSGGEVEGTFRAIEQMMSKGTVQAEELRGQLGERLPGAFRIAAESMNLTTVELGKQLKLGTIMAETFLPNLARALTKTFGEIALENVNSFTGSMNNLSTQTLLFGVEFDRVTGISKAAIGILHGAANAVEFLRRQFVNIVSVIGAVGAFMAALARKQIAVGILFVAGAVQKLALAVVGLNAAVAAGAAKTLLTALRAFAIPILAMVATFVILKKVLSSTTESLDDMETSIEGFGNDIDGVKNLGNAFTTLTKNIDDAVAETKVTLAVMAEMGKFPVKDVELLTLRYQTLAHVFDMSQDELKALHDKLVDIGEVPTAMTFEAIADALFRVRGDAIAAADALQNTIARMKGFADFGRTMEDLELRFRAMKEGGLEQLKTFEQVDSVILALRRSYEALGVEETTIEAIIRVLTAALTRNREELEALTAAEKAAKLAAKEAIKAQKDKITSLEDATKAIEQLRRQNMELAKGPGSFEVFSKITIHVEEMTAALIANGVESMAAAVWAREYQQLLEENLVLTGSTTKALEKQNKALMAFGRTMADLNARYEALQEGGLTQLKLFDEVGAVVETMRRKYQEMGFDMVTIEALMAVYTATLVRNRVAISAAEQAEKDRLDTQKEGERAVVRFEGGIIRAVNTLNLLRASNRALAEGPDSFEYFTKVTQKLARYREQLERITDNQTVINVLVKQYETTLEAALAMSDRFARANQQMATAITGALEDIIVTGGSVKDMLHDLAKELLRVMLRALFLDKLQAGLANLFGGGAAPSVLSNASKGILPGPSKGSFAHGGSFKVPGSGGSDHVPVAFMAKPGEVVSIRRPDQLAGSRGGGVTIIQNNNFEGGGLADPNVLIPLLEENNRRLKGEFLQELSRGAYR